MRRSTRARSRRGIAGIIAGLILFVILFTVGTGYFLWINTNNLAYTQALASKNAANLAQKSEVLTLNATVMGCPLACSSYNVTVTNPGGIPVEVVSIVGTDQLGNIQAPGIVPLSNVAINPGGGVAQIETGIPLNPSQTVVLKAVTQRGSIFVATYQPPAVSTDLEYSSIPAGGAVWDSATINGGYSPTGTVTYSWYSDDACTSLISSATVVISKGVVPNSPSVTFAAAGQYSWQATYSGDSNNPGVPTDPSATSPCEQLSVVTTATKLTTSMPTSVPVETAVMDTATLSGETANAGGSVSYYYSTTDQCPVVGSTLVSTVTVTNGVIPHSSNETLPLGNYYWYAVYSGDTNNGGSTSPCEPLSVEKASPSITTELSSATVIAGQPATDSSTLSGATGDAGGTVTYYYYSDDACGSGVLGSSTVTVSEGVVPDSEQETFGTAGNYSWNAVYSGDSNNVGPVTSPCEPLIVQTNTTLTTTLSADSIPLGGSVTDNATLSGSSEYASGTIQFYYSTDFACPSSSAIAVGAAIHVDGDNTYPVVAPPVSQSFSIAGTYYWYAVYSGDTYNAPSTSPCEPLTVGLGLTTLLSSPTIPLGSPVSDTATLQYATGTSGSVSFYFFSKGTCTGPSTLEGTAPITTTETDGALPVTVDSDTVTPTTAGSYSWDANYTVAGESIVPTSPCEQLTVIAPTGANVGSLSEVLGSLKFYFASPYCNSVENSTTMPDCLGDGVAAGGYYGYGLSFATQGADCNTGEGFFFYGANPSCVPVVFSVTLTNTEPFRSITLGPQSFLWLDGTCQTYNDYFFFEGHCSGTNYFSSPLSQGYWIVDGPPTSSGSGAMPTPYTKAVTIPAGGQATLYFYCGGPCTTAASLLPPATNPPPGTYVQASLNLYGTYSNGVPFGQNIPFISSYVSPVEIEGCATGNTYPNSADPCWTANTPNLAARPGTNITLAVGDFPCTAVTPGEPFFGEGSTCSSTDSFPIYAYWVNSTGGVIPDGSTPSCLYADQINGGYCTITFTVPSDTSPGQTYSMYVTSDGVNNAYATVTITGESTTTITCDPSTITAGGSTSCTATVTGTSPTGTVTWSQSGTGTVTFSSTTCTLVDGTCSVSVTGKSAGSVTITGSYGGDANNQGSSGTFSLAINKATPTITTTVSSGGTVSIGSSATDTATLVGAYDPTGSVTFTVYSSSACTGTPAFTSTNTISGSSATSGSFTPSSTGTYYWQASYAGNSNNNGYTTTCGAGGEILTVGVASPTITTVLSHSSITIGSSATDTATLVGAYDPTGSVTFTVYSNSGCTVEVFTSTNTISGSSSTSSPFSPSSAGTYYWQASYAGDSNNNGYKTTCGPSGETLTVNKATPTITTTLSNSGIITIGGSATDTATLTEAYDPSGSVTYSVFTNSACTTAVPTGSEAGQYTPDSVTVTSNGAQTPSTAFTPASAVAYYWHAVYSGDVNNNGVTSSCEMLSVSKASPTIITTVSSGGTITIGSSATDQGTLSGGYGTLTGTLVFKAYTSATCSGTASFTSSAITVSGNGPYTSSSFAPTSVNTYYWQATFTDTDGNNAGFTSACGGAGETLTVNRASPTISTTASISGGFAKDSGTFSGAYGTLTGSLVFKAYSSSSCTGIAAFTSNAITVDGNGPYTSNSFSPGAGTYYWQATFTDTDGNNAGFTSACGGAGETLTVALAGEVAALQVSSSNPREASPSLLGRGASNTLALSNSQPAGVLLHHSAVKSEGAESSLSFGDLRMQLMDSQRVIVV